MTGTLYLVATPIGNLKDISLRALEVLKSVDIIACEDTRHTRKLLNHYEISKRLVSYHEHNEAERAEELVGNLQRGESVAVVSDAGTPGISDPSFRLVRAARDAGIAVVPVPGASAFVNAVIASGIPSDSIFFGGFLPSKMGERVRRLEEVRDIPATLVFYEAPHRLVRSLADCRQVLGPRQAAVARELTKLHEEIVSGTLEELAERYSDANIRGEAVLVIDRARTTDERIAGEMSLPERVRQLENEGTDAKAALKKAAKEFGISRSEAYRMMLAEKNTGT